MVLTALLSKTRQSASSALTRLPPMAPALGCYRVLEHICLPPGGDRIGRGTETVAINTGGKTSSMSEGSSLKLGPVTCGFVLHLVGEGKGV
jgi:hypothetical protein